MLTSTIELMRQQPTKINEEQLTLLSIKEVWMQEEAVSLIVNGFCKEVLQQLPMEFAVEAQKLVAYQSGRKRRIMLNINKLRMQKLIIRNILKGIKSLDIKSWRRYTLLWDLMVLVKVL